jgi:hypothetical protein
MILFYWIFLHHKEKIFFLVQSNKRALAKDLVEYGIRVYKKYRVYNYKKFEK